MATAYIGHRPILRGRNSGEFLFTQKEKTLSGKTRSSEGTYSSYTHFGPGLLTGAPDNDHVPGEGRHPSDVATSRRFLGLDTQAPMDGAGDGERIEGARYRPLENKSAGNAKAFPAGYGHAPRDEDYGHYNNFEFDGVASADALEDPGHPLRGVDGEGTAATFGRFGPHVHQGVGTQALEGDGQTVPEGYDNDYGRNRINEWHGVASGKAL